MSSRCPPTQHGSKKRPPHVSTVTLDSVDTDKGGCDHRGWGAVFSDQRKKSWIGDVRRSRINASKSKNMSDLRLYNRMSIDREAEPRPLFNLLDHKKWKVMVFCHRQTDRLLKGKSCFICSSPLSRRDTRTYSCLSTSDTLRCVCCKVETMNSSITIFPTESNFVG